MVKLIISNQSSSLQPLQEPLCGTGLALALGLISEDHLENDTKEAEPGKCRLGFTLHPAVSGSLIQPLNNNSFLIHFYQYLTVISVSIYLLLLTAARLLAVCDIETGGIEGDDEGNVQKASIVTLVYRIYCMLIKICK